MKMEMNKLDIYKTAEGWIATYTGLTGSGESVKDEEAHNIQFGDSRNDLIANSAVVWGADLDETEVTIHD